MFKIRERMFEAERAPPPSGKDLALGLHVALLHVVKHSQPVVESIVHGSIPGRPTLPSHRRARGLLGAAGEAAGAIGRRENSNSRTRRTGNIWQLWFPPRGENRVLNRRKSCRFESNLNGDVGHHFRQPIIVTFCPSGNRSRRLALGVADLPQALAKGAQALRVPVRRHAAEGINNGHCRLLCHRPDWPRTSRSNRMLSLPPTPRQVLGTNLNRSESRRRAACVSLCLPACFG